MLEFDEILFIFTKILKVAMTLNVQISELVIYFLSKNKGITLIK